MEEEHVSSNYVTAVFETLTHRGKRLGEVPPFRDPLDLRADGPALAGTLSISQCTACSLAP